MNYIYDGLGNRVEKANGTLYWYGPGGEVLDETNLTGSLTSEYVFFAGKRVARRDASGNIYYYAEDFIGSSRVITQANGTLCSDADFLPFGQEVDYTSGCAQNYKFEGKERDIETGNDNFGARYYRSALGRWMSPDWSAIPAPVPYANLTNPQTVNLYAMTSDKPETFADLDGHLGGIPEAIATNPNGFGEDMEVDSGWYEDKDGNIVFSGSAPPDPTPQQPTRTPQNPTQVQQQQQQTSCYVQARAKIVDPGGNGVKHLLEQVLMHIFRIKHMFWTVRGSNGQEANITGGPDPSHPGKLGSWVVPTGGNAKATSYRNSGKVFWTAQGATCSQVDAMEHAGDFGNWNHGISYKFFSGPNSNSSFNFVGAAGGMPRLSTFWTPGATTPLP